MTARRPSSRNEGSLPSTGSSAIGYASPRASGCRVEGMEVDDEPLVKRIGRVDVHAGGGYDVVVFEPNAADTGLARVRLEIEHHSFFEHYGRVLRSRTEIGSFPRIHTRPVAEAVEHIRVGRREYLGIGCARA